MNHQQKQIVLRIARQAVEAAVGGVASPSVEVPADDPVLNAHCGCFVTLKNRGRLRGCIGRFTADQPLTQVVAEMARASATEDPRFLGAPIAPAELDDLDVEISVLSPLKRTNNPLSLRPGIDGIYIRRGCASGCFLPQVATETGWTAEEFLSCCCAHKAGLAADAWKDPKTEVFLFTAEVFGARLKDL